MMEKKTFKSLYQGEFNPHPFEMMQPYELARIEKDKYELPETRRLARKIRIEKEQRATPDNHDRRG